MKCLEFLYFYLLDENAPDADAPEEDTGAWTAPSSPTGHTRSALSMSQLSDSSVGSDASTSSTGSTASASTSATTASAASHRSTTQDAAKGAGKDAPLAPAAAIHTGHRTALSRDNSGGTPRPLAFLRRDLDFVPQTPAGAGRGASTPRHVQDSDAPADSEWKTPRRLLPRMTSVGEGPCTPAPLARARGHRRAQTADEQSAPASPATPERDAGLSRVASPVRRPGVRTMEEKKAILGSMMGNVDTLVEGVKKAGIWGLG